MILLEALNIKQYVRDRLLFAVDQLRVHKNDRVGLIGRNGSGKTTLLRILAGKSPSEEGNVIRHVSCELLPQLKRTAAAKSGGEVTQKYIQEVLAKNPELLLADEPTTNLDADHIEWLEKKLNERQGAFVLVSHDRAFLDALCTTIWEIDEGRINTYAGNYSDYEKQKEAGRHQEQIAYETYVKKKRQLEEALKLKERRAERAAKRPGHVESGAAKPYYAKKQKKLQKTANAMETRLEKLEQAEKVKEIQPLKMDLPNAETFKHRIILRAEDISGRIGKRVLWEKTSFFVRGGEKLAIIGPNGSGKTTLVRKIVGRAPGITCSPSLKPGYFSQNLNILDKEKTIIENVRSTSKQDESTVRTVLARMHFFREDVFKPVAVLSGGERVRAALAKLFLSDVNMLILDEPTNYLDIEAARALESLLKEYEGSVLFVSHDRRFIDGLATRILEIRDQKIHLFEGTYRQYKQDQPKKNQDNQNDRRLLLETKITEVLSRLSIEPSEELEMEFQNLLKEKRNRDRS
ncbi:MULTISPECIES: Vga family ABC-F type ribosomal protection protein [unclassified Sporolactobacillus]|uniref:Vga family ABC-F type ribosomal protection protein n=1 Tax=unclassified Sporolactobacillus TaxID=2628533 RepID=UPI0023677C92|nr:ABC-F type ribosomal protection protein [Sporolactobacillus sp. CQH2019]MDD9149946.1 ABC-F type ribosomal protection protein [Sporolactobacillus sp. CQH2019]